MKTVRLGRLAGREARRDHARLIEKALQGGDALLHSTKGGVEVGRTVRLEVYGEGDARHVAVKWRERGVVRTTSGVLPSGNLAR